MSINSSAINSGTVNGTGSNGSSGIIPPLVIDTPELYSGCCSITVPSGKGSGVLYKDRYTIITAAHVVAGITPDQYASISIVFNSTATITPPEVDSISIHEGYVNTGHIGSFDIAVIRLKQPVPTSINAYSLASSPVALGTEFVRCGYSGDRDPITWEFTGTYSWHMFANRYEALGSAMSALAGAPTPLNTLVYDYDNGYSATDALGGILGIINTGIAGEGGGRPGDSGSPAFISVVTVNGTELQICGITSGAISVSAYDVVPGGNGSPGEISYDTDMYATRGWVSAAAGLRGVVLALDEASSFTGVMRTWWHTFDVVEDAAFSAIGGAALDVTQSLAAFDASGVVTIVASLQAAAPKDQFASTGGGQFAVTQPAPLFSAELGGVFNVTDADPLVSLSGYIGPVASVDLEFDTPTFDAYGAGEFNAAFDVDLFTATVLTGGVASVAVSQEAGFSGSLVTVQALATMAVLQPSMVANYGGLYVEQSAAFSSASATPVVTDLIAYSMNIKTAETTTYSNYEFKFIIRLGHDYYGVKADGLYQLGGLSDDGVDINASFRTAETDFGVTNHKRVPYVYMDSETDTTISPVVDGVQGNTFAGAFSGHRTRLARGYNGRFWQMEVANVGGGPLKVGSLEMLAEITSRKV